MSVKGCHGGVGFVIRGSWLGILAASGHYLPEPIVPGAELQGAWACIFYVRRILQINHLIIEDDFTTVIVWIHEARKSRTGHPLLHDIDLLQDFFINIVRHVYWETNSVANWVASFIANYSGPVLWTDMGDVRGDFGISFFLTFLFVFILKL